MYYLEHTGVLGMKWGIRRYQNKDGTLTSAGKKRYAQTGVEGYEYKSRLTKHHEKYAEKRAAKADELEAKGKTAKAEKMRAKSEMNAKKAEYNREIDKRMQTYSKSVKTGGNIAARVLTSNSIGGKAYQTALAAFNGQNREDTTKKVGAWLVGNLGQTTLGMFGDLGIRAVGYQLSKRS